jgi:hypothetical protein
MEIPPGTADYTALIGHRRGLMLLGMLVVLMQLFPPSLSLRSLMRSVELYTRSLLHLGKQV